MNTKSAAMLEPARSRRPDLEFKVEISRSDKEKSAYYLVPFEVPEGVTQMELRYVYPKADDCVIDLGAADPSLDPFPSETGLRGWSGGARDRFVIGVDAATPGFEAGAIPSGKWQALLGLYRVPADKVSVEISVFFSFELRTERALVPPPQPTRLEAGWYCGDLQCHTFHSDAQGSPQRLHKTALREGLDFLAVTDHNTVSQQRGYFDAASSDRLIFVPAYEFTTEFGHGNVYGAREVFDFRAEDGAAVVGMVRRIRDSGALFSINHDKPNHPWRWDVPEAIDCMEVWQSHWLAGNHISLARYQQRLSSGMRITAIGGSDFHQPSVEPENNPVTLARPTTFLCLEELSVDGILDALRAGRSFVTENPEGPKLMISVGDVMMGGEVAADAGRLDIAVKGAAGERVDIWDASGLMASFDVGSDDWSGDCDISAAKGFVRAELAAVASRDRIIADIDAFLGERWRDSPEWAGSVDEPVRRALTSPIYIV